MTTTRTEYLRGYQDALDGKTADPPPEVAPGARVGSVIRITVGGTFFKRGTRARLVRQDEDGDWWADFGAMGNAPGSFNRNMDGVWCVGQGPRFEVIG